MGFFFPLFGVLGFMCKDDFLEISFRYFASQVDEIFFLVCKLCIEWVRLWGVGRVYVYRLISSVRVLSWLLSFDYWFLDTGLCFG